MERLEDTGRHVVHELERFLNTLGTIAGVSPLLGLLGTVGGIIKAFNAINAGGVGDPRMLSGGIAQALITTAAGLCVAIPSLIAYRYLRGRVDRIVIEIEKDAIQLADALEAAQAAAARRHAMNLKPRRHEDPEINMVSLIDVVLMLVIFFMLSANFSGEGRLRIQLPQASAAPRSAPRPAALVVTVTAGGSYLRQQPRAGQRQRRHPARARSSRWRRRRATSP